MPNWVKNQFSVSGEKEQVEKFLSTVLKENEDKEKEFDFNKVIPMPDSLNVESSSASDDALFLYLFKEYNYISTQKTLPKAFEKDFGVLDVSRYLYYRLPEMAVPTVKQLFKEVGAKSFEGPSETFFSARAINKLKRSVRDVDMAFLAGAELVFCASEEKYQEKLQKMESWGRSLGSALRLGKVLFDNIVLYGAKDWYEWCFKNWGTKWNACESEILIFESQERDGEIEPQISFCTAWSSPDPVFEKMVQQYPELAFEGSWADEDIGNNTGTWSGKNGAFSLREEENGSDPACALYLSLWGK